MFDPIYDTKRPKRNFQDDCPIYVPSLKKTRLWDGNLTDTQDNNFNHELADMPLIQSEPSHLRVMNTPEYFSAIFLGVNDSFETDMMELSKYKYMPDLNAAQNPHYYEYNKLLFELYLERVRRSKSHNPSSSQTPL